MTLFTDRIAKIADQSLTVFAHAEVTAEDNEILEHARADQTLLENSRSNGIVKTFSLSSTLFDETRDLSKKIQALPDWKKFILNRIIS